MDNRKSLGREIVAKLRNDLVNDLLVAEKRDADLVLPDRLDSAGNQFCGSAISCFMYIAVAIKSHFYQW